MVQRITLLSKNDPAVFPDPGHALTEPNGLLAAGGDLSPQRLESAYRQGIFPWFSAGQPILWWSPDPRCVLLPERLRVSRSLRKSARNKGYSVTADTAFLEVMHACAAPRPGEPGTWIGDEMIQAYHVLFRRGLAHSVEIRQQGELVGGLYGVALGRAFFGESMFSRRADASKLALLALARQLTAWGYDLIDCQVSSSHLSSLGAQDMPRPEFLQRLNIALERPGQPAPWRFDDELADLAAFRQVAPQDE